MRLSSAIQDYLIEIEVRKYTPKTIRGYRNNLSLFLHFCEDVAGVDTIEDVTPAIVRQFTKYMIDKGRKGTYINGLLKTIKSFITYAYEAGYGGFHTNKNFKWCKEEKPLIVAFKPEHVRMMLKDCTGGDYISVRDKVVLTTLFETGVRCWELCCIKPEDIHDDYIIIAYGKNHKQRVVPITAILKREMLRYDRVKADYFALKTTEDYYFLSYHGRQLTNSAVEHIVKRHASGVQGIRASPHTCRHFFAQQQVKLGTDIYTISRLLGHENIQITQTYLNSLRDEDVIAIAKEKSVLMNI
jgi:integrase/recombinase XerD